MLDCPKIPEVNFKECNEKVDNPYNVKIFWSDGKSPKDFWLTEKEQDYFRMKDNTGREVTFTKSPKADYPENFPIFGEYYDIQFTVDLDWSEEQKIKSSLIRKKDEQKP